MGRKPMASRNWATQSHTPHQLSTSLPNEHQLAMLAEQSSRARNRSAVVPYGVVAAHQPQNNYEDDAFWLNFPPGVRFTPRDEELLLFYLKPKAEGRKLPLTSIKDVYLYNYNPEDLAAMYRPQDEDDKQWYFFTPREKKYPNGGRPSRSAGDGYWKATGADKRIESSKSSDPVLLGSKKTLVFYKGNSPKGVKTNWIMHEYTLNSTTRRSKQYDGSMNLDPHTLVRLYETSTKGNGKGAIVSEEEEEQLINADESLPEDLVSPNSNTSDSTFVEDLPNEMQRVKVEENTQHVPVYCNMQHVSYSSENITRNRHDGQLDGCISSPDMFPSYWNNNSLPVGPLEDFGIHNNGYLSDALTDAFYNHNVDTSNYFDFHRATSSSDLREFDSSEYLVFKEDDPSAHRDECH